MYIFSISNVKKSTFVKKKLFRMNCLLNCFQKTEFFFFSIISKSSVRHFSTSNFSFKFPLLKEQKEKFLIFSEHKFWKEEEFFQKKFLLRMVLYFKVHSRFKLYKLKRLNKQALKKNIIRKYLKLIKIYLANSLVMSLDQINSNFFVFLYFLTKLSDDFFSVDRSFLHKKKLIFRNLFFIYFFAHGRMKYFLNIMRFNFITSKLFLRFKPRRKHFKALAPFGFFLLFYSPFRSSFSFSSSQRLIFKRRSFFSKLNNLNNFIILKRYSPVNLKKLKKFRILKSKVILIPAKFYGTSISSKIIKPFIFKTTPFIKSKSQNFLNNAFGFKQISRNHFYAQKKFSFGNFFFTKEYLKRILICVNLLLKRNSTKFSYLVHSFKSFGFSFIKKDKRIFYNCILRLFRFYFLFLKYITKIFRYNLLGKHFTINNSKFKKISIFGCAFFRNAKLHNFKFKNFKKFFTDNLRIKKKEYVKMIYDANKSKPTVKREQIPSVDSKFKLNKLPRLQRIFVFRRFSDFKKSVYFLIFSAFFSKSGYFHLLFIYISTLYKKIYSFYYIGKKFLLNLSLLFFLNNFNFFNIGKAVNNCADLFFLIDLLLNKKNLLHSLKILPLHYYYPFFLNRYQFGAKFFQFLNILSSDYKNSSIKFLIRKIEPLILMPDKNRFFLTIFNKIRVTPSQSFVLDKENLENLEKLKSYSKKLAKKFDSLSSKDLFKDFRRTERKKNLLKKKKKFTKKLYIRYLESLKMQNLKKSKILKKKFLSRFSKEISLSFRREKYFVRSLGKRFRKNKKEIRRKFNRFITNVLFVIKFIKEKKLLKSYYKHNKRIFRLSRFHKFSTSFFLRLKVKRFYHGNADKRRLSFRFSFSNASKFVFSFLSKSIASSLNCLSWHFYNYSFKRIYPCLLSINFPSKNISLVKTWLFSLKRDYFNFVAKPSFFFFNNFKDYLCLLNFFFQFGILFFVKFVFNYIRQVSLFLNFLIILKDFFLFFFKKIKYPIFYANLKVSFPKTINRNFSSKSIYNFLLKKRIYDKLKKNRFCYFSLNFFVPQSFFTGKKNHFLKCLYGTIIVLNRPKVFFSYISFLNGYFSLILLNLHNFKLIIDSFINLKFLRIIFDFFPSILLNLLSSISVSSFTQISVHKFFSSVNTFNYLVGFLTFFYTTNSIKKIKYRKLLKKKKNKLKLLGHKSNFKFEKSFNYRKKYKINDFFYKPFLKKKLNHRFYWSFTKFQFSQRQKSYLSQKAFKHAMYNQLFSEFFRKMPFDKKKKKK